MDWNTAPIGTTIGSRGVALEALRAGRIIRSATNGFDYRFVTNRSNQVTDELQVNTHRVPGDDWQVIGLLDGTWITSGYNFQTVDNAPFTPDPNFAANTVSRRAAHALLTEHHPVIDASGHCWMITEDGSLKRALDGKMFRLVSWTLWKSAPEPFKVAAFEDLEFTKKEVQSALEDGSPFTWLSPNGAKLWRSGNGRLTVESPIDGSWNRLELESPEWNRLPKDGWTRLSKRGPEVPPPKPDPIDSATLDSLRAGLAAFDGDE